VARTLFLTDDPRHREMYESLKEAIQMTVAAIRAGTTLAELRRAFYRNLRHEPDWVMLTGPLIHGVGIWNSELPDFDHPAEARGYPEVLQAQTVLAMSNIGLYSPEGWGVRYEETILIEEERATILSADE
jgi:Xaa-Pro aminopeptidase